MRLLIMLFAIGLGVATSLEVTAATADLTTKKTVVKKKAKVAKAKAAKGLKQAATKLTSGVATARTHKDELSTDVKFDDSVLHGQYQTPDEALVKVENEKGLNDLLGVRKHFKDRLNTASEQE